MSIHIYSDSFGFDTQPKTWPYELEKLRKLKLMKFYILDEFDFLH